MTRLLLRFLNAPVLILMSLVGIALQTSLFSFWVLPDFQPDVVLLMVVWFALRRDFLEGGILTLLLGGISESHSAAPAGTFLVTYMVVYLAGRLANRVLVIPDLRTYGYVTVVAAFLARIATKLMVYLLGISAIHWQTEILLVISSAGVNGMLSPVLFRWLNRFDFVTYKGVRPDQILDELSEVNELNEISGHYEFHAPTDSAADWANDRTRAR